MLAVLPKPPTQVNGSVRMPPHPSSSPVTPNPRALYPKIVQTLDWGIISSARQKASQRLVRSCGVNKVAKLIFSIFFQSLPAHSNAMKRIFFLIKFFDNPDHADDFVRGRIFANSLSRFKQIEGDDRSGRVDRNEGTSAWFQPDKGGRLIINGMDISDDLAGPLQIQMNWLNPLNIFCIHAAHSGDLDLANFSNDNIDTLRQELTITDECMSLDKHAVAVKRNEWLSCRAWTRQSL